MYATSPWISSGFKLLPYAGILFLPLSITSFNSASLLPATFVSEKPNTPMFLPAGESPLPDAPWHTAHFALYSDALLSSPLAWLTNRIRRAATAAIIRNDPDMPRRIIAHLRRAHHIR